MAAQGSVASNSSLRSWPAQKCLPSAASTTTRTSSSASARSKAASISSISAALRALAGLGRSQGDGGHRAGQLAGVGRLVGEDLEGGHEATACTGSLGAGLAGAGLVGAGLAGQAEHPLADDGALDLVGPGEDRGGLVVEPGPLPLAVARVAGGAARQHGGRAQQVEGQAVQPLAHLGPVQLEGRSLGADGLAGFEPRQRAPVVELEQLDLDEGLGQALAGAHVVEAAPGRGQAQQLLQVLGVDDQLAGVGAPLVGQRGRGHPPAVVHRPDHAVVGHEHLSQEHLVEVGLTGDLAQRVGCRPRGPACRWRRR